MADVTELLVGHDCTECGATISVCDQHMREHGEGCCSSCSLGDTHGLLQSLDDAWKVGQRVGEVEAQTEGHTYLLAQMVIFRTEAANAIRQLRAAEQRHEEELALLRGRVDSLERQARQHIDSTTELVEELEERLSHFDQHQAVVDYTTLQERVQVVELCIEGIEKRLGLKRKAAPAAAQAAQPAHPARREQPAPDLPPPPAGAEPGPVPGAAPAVAAPDAVHAAPSAAPSDAPR